MKHRLRQAASWPLLLLGALLIAGTPDPAPAATEVSKIFTLDNGLKVYLFESRTIPLVNIAVAVNCGSKDETPRTSGLAHLLEHYVLFRGTSTRAGEDISREVRRHGAYFNAHTGQDLTQFEISLPSAFVDFGLNNQKDILFNLKIAQPEVATEKAVILEELNQLADDPFRRAGQAVFENIFAAHAYSLPLPGRAESIRGLTAQDLETLYSTYFVPANISLAVVGDFSLADMEDKVRSIFGAVPGRPFNPSRYPAALPPAKDVDITLEMDVNKAYCLIGMLGPDYNHPDQYAVDTLSQILGRGINPILNRALRGGRDLVQTVSMSYSTFKHGGLIMVALTLDPGNLRAAKREAVKFLRSARTLDFGPDDVLGDAQFYAFNYLRSAKNQIRFQVHRAQERGLNIAASLARYLILQDPAVDRNYLAGIERLTTSDLRAAAGRYLSSGKKIVVSVVPRKKSEVR